MIVKIKVNTRTTVTLINFVERRPSVERMSFMREQETFCLLDCQTTMKPTGYMCLVP